MAKSKAPSRGRLTKEESSACFDPAVASEDSVQERRAENGSVRQPSELRPEPENGPLSPFARTEGLPDSDAGSRHPLESVIGSFAEEPLWDEFLEAMREYERQREAQESAGE